MRGLLFDMDGVIYNSEQLIPGAPETLEWVRRRGIPHLFVTNTTSRGRAALAEKLTRFGIPTTEAQILTPPVAAAEWLRGRREGVVAALFVRPAARGEFDGVNLLPDEADHGATDVVVGDMGEAWDFHVLNRAFRLLHSNPKCNLIALGMTRFWHTPEGVKLDTAPFVVALEHATGRIPIVFGKPATAFFRAAAEKLQLPAEEILMIGDDIVTDVGGAQQAGLKGALVKTGKFREADLRRDAKPDFVLDSIAALPSWWEQRQ
jgi:phospholysine phosphohistidine inorganic pyrophosphate phosphatase